MVRRHHVLADRIRIADLTTLQRIAQFSRYDVLHHSNSFLNPDNNFNLLRGKQRQRLVVEDTTTDDYA